LGNQYGFKDETQYGKAPVALIDLPNPVDEKLDVRSRRMLERADAFVCTNPQQYAEGDKAVSECAALEKRIKEIHDPICVATNTAHKIATKARKDLVDPIKRASKIIDGKLGNYKMAHDLKIAEERKALEEKARKDQEAHTLAQALQMSAEDAPSEAIEAVLNTAYDPVQVAKPETQELLSKNSRTPDWDIEILDKVLVPDYYKTVNEGAIRAAVKAAKGNITIHGVRIFDTFKTRRKVL